MLNHVFKGFDEMSFDFVAFFGLICSSQNIIQVLPNKHGEEEIHECF